MDKHYNYRDLIGVNIDHYINEPEELKNKIDKIIDSILKDVDDMSYTNIVDINGKITTLVDRLS